MKVSEMILLLQQMDPDLQVVVDLHSEYILAGEPRELLAQEPRSDDWVHHLRGDRPQQTYCYITGS